MPVTSMQERRWQSEAAFFDAQALRSSDRVGPVDPAVLARYSRASIASARYPLEYAFALAGDLSNLSVLDIGCGEGANSSLLALLGASVTGIDISPGAIEIAARRAKANGVSHRVKFRVDPLEIVNDWEQEFDVIWCEAFLHHVLPDLAAVTQRLVSWLKPGGRLIIIEPISLSPTLRILRRMTPVNAEATPDERPLLLSELRFLQRTVPNSTTQFFRCFGRLVRFVLPDHGYEHASPLRRRLCDSLANMDRVLFRLPFGGELGSIAVIEGRRNV